ncbi:hypothetical protein MRX96_050065 [Rhipicephalus microplus]
MADRLSGVAIIICIALGVLTFLILFIFAKRQIMRFTLKSKHSPHVPIDIAYEPTLLKPNECLSEHSNLSQVQPQHLLRMGVVDKLSELEEHIGGIDKTRNPQTRTRCSRLPSAHSPKEFTHEHYLAFMDILEQLKSSLPSREKTTPRRRDTTQPPKSSESPNVNFLSSTMTLPLPDAILPGNNGRPVTEPLASCRPSNIASAEDDNRDAALETSV